MDKNKLLTWAEIDLNALRYNLGVVKKLVSKNFQGRGPRPEILAVVKAGAYGHGMPEVAKTLDRAGATVFGVSNVTEGKALRQIGIKKHIVLFENPLPEFAPDLVTYRLTPMLCTLELAVALNRAAKRLNRVAEVHIKIDTGMGRLGVWHEDAEDFIRKVRMFPNLKITGLASHFPAADTNPRFTRKQVVLLENLAARLAPILPKGLSVHTANSIGASFYSNRICDLVRPGLMLYGLYPSDALKRRVNLKPVMSVKSRVIFLKKIQPGRTVSYGQTFVAGKPRKIATLPVGYSDGYFRSLSNRAQVLIGGKRCPQVGRVTMDQIMVDVSGLKDVCLGQEAVILGRQGQAEISAEELARWAGTINYEVVCNLGNRIERIYKK